MIELTGCPEEGIGGAEAIDGVPDIDFAMEPNGDYGQVTPEQDADNAMKRIVEGLGFAGINPMVAPIVPGEPIVAQTEQITGRRLAGGPHVVERVPTFILPTVEEVVTYVDHLPPEDLDLMYTPEPGVTFLPCPYEPVPHHLSDDVAMQLRDFVWEETRNMELSGDLLVLHGGRTKPPRNIGEYRFVPMLPDIPQSLRDSVGAIGQNALSYRDVRFEYSDKYASFDRTPYMDAGIGLGLAYRDRLVAVCAGGLAQEGLIIRQIQDVSNKIAPKGATPDELRKFKFSSGLHGGIDWKMTLVRGWSDLSQRAVSSVLGTEHEMPVWIQSSINNIWAYRTVYGRGGKIVGSTIREPKLLENLIPKYDGVALALGGVRDTTTNNYLLPMAVACRQTLARRERSWPTSSR
ncbi:MAG TPA: hypothetical protein VF809_00635 [Candidatus Saccharimonadales bacterium]